jgi:hypothetical protein
MESMRDIGYSLESAIADIIDNCITAQANNVDIRFSWNRGVPWIAIIDDGCGMDSKTLIKAMRFGSSHPKNIRRDDDLGRFGLGMKTASISQCCSLTVISKYNSKISGCNWDLDNIKKNDCAWNLGVFEEVDLKKNPVIRQLFDEKLNIHASGTIVLWEQMDRIEYDGETSNKGNQHFASILAKTREHLELVFHRYISPSIGQRKVNIFMNNDKLDAFNPFNENNIATKELPEQVISLDGQKIIVQPFVLPHHSKIPKQEYLKYARSDGYLHNQGFYIYRNQRLIINGTWFRLIKKDELNKLIRVRIDIPNSLDHLWKIDVKKSSAFPPANIRNQLKNIIDKIEYEGKKVYHQRGHKHKSKVKDPFWIRKIVSSKVTYQINTEHPLIKYFINNLDKDKITDFNDILLMLQNYFPQDMFFADLASSPEQIQNRKTDNELFERALGLYIESWGGLECVTQEDASEWLLHEPFIYNKAMAQELFIKRGLL